MVVLFMTEERGIPFQAEKAPANLCVMRRFVTQNTVNQDARKESSVKKLMPLLGLIHTVIYKRCHTRPKFLEPSLLAEDKFYRL